MSKVPKKIEVCISIAISPEKYGVEVDFLSADKHQRLLQIDTIILGMCGQFVGNFHANLHVKNELYHSFVS